MDDTGSTILFLKHIISKFWYFNQKGFGGDSNWCESKEGGVLRFIGHFSSFDLS
jgi:hypothetical protein